MPPEADSTPGQTDEFRLEGLRTSDDELHIPTGPITGARAQQLQQTMQGLVLRILDEPSTGIHYSIPLNLYWRSGFDFQSLLSGLAEGLVGFASEAADNLVWAVVAGA
ncbi:hypothetical protein CDL15_Pgr006338 [Punica granatum]|uniref:Uncharacterized protein n=1 Tax=Punica granatum TaxID=22663 RepID=A0A218W9B0_PUNGR|nr:hypothetical protein CDL15_Pgr006338 [Punica granatum]